MRIASGRNGAPTTTPIGNTYSISLFMIAVCGLSRPGAAVWRATECRAVMWVKTPAAIISGIITMSMLVIEVPAPSSCADAHASPTAPSLAPKRLAALNDSTPAASKK